MKRIQLACLIVAAIALGGIDRDDEAQRSGVAVTDRTSQQMTIILVCVLIAGGAEVVSRRHRRNQERIIIDPSCVIDGNPDRHSGLGRV